MIVLETSPIMPPTTGTNDVNVNLTVRAAIVSADDASIF
jgi:hypothetical protein